MRERIWYSLTNVKFKALYTCECSKIAERYGRLTSFILAVASASSIATWAVWKQVPIVWAAIIAGGQLLHIGKDYLPSIKNDKAFLEMSFEYEFLYLEYEQLWYAFEHKTVDETSAGQKFYQFRQKEVEIEKSHKDARCPTPKRRMKRINEATNRALNMNFPQGA